MARVVEQFLKVIRVAAAMLLNNLENLESVAAAMLLNFFGGRVAVACTRVSSGRGLVTPPGTLPGIQERCANDARVNAGRRTDPAGRPTDPKPLDSERHKARHGTQERAVTGGGGYEVALTAVQGAESSRARGSSTRGTRSPPSHPAPPERLASEPGEYAAVDLRGTGGVFVDFEHGDSPDLAHL